jgi:hypothetical protein
MKQAAKEGCKDIKLEAFKDFATRKDNYTKKDSGDEKDDDTIYQVGHGIKGVNLLNYVFPNAAIYVSRVFATNKVEEGSKERMVKVSEARETHLLMMSKLTYKVIKWAYRKRVDIVATATGFDMDDPAIKQKIERAI